MKVFLFMGLPYQGKSTIALSLLRFLQKIQIDTTYISTDGCRSEYWVNAKKEGTFDYSEESEAKSWKLFLDKIKSWTICALPSNCLILDGTMTNYYKILDLFDALTLNIDFVADSKLVIQVFVVGSTEENQIWKPVAADFGDPNTKINNLWKERCELKISQKIDSFVPEVIFNNKVIELRQTLKKLNKVIQSFVQSNNKKLICTISHIPHHAKLKWKNWVK